MRITQLDLTTQYKSIEEEINGAISAVLKSGIIINGDNVRKIEDTIAEYSGNRYGIGVANGSDAIYIALKALGVGEGDAVICPAFTFFATAGSIVRVGATPIFIDIDSEDYNIDVSKLLEFLENHSEYDAVQEKLFHTKSGKAIKAIIPVHLFGKMCYMDKIMSMANKYKIKVIEDCAQSICSEYKGRRAGSYGDLSTFSFYPTKNLSTYGDGGMIVTSIDEYDEYCRLFRSHGSKIKYFHKFVGINSRLDELHAAILNVKVKYLKTWLDERFKVAGRYQELFDHYNLLQKVKLPVDNINKFSNHREHTFHQYVIQVEDRDKLQTYLKENGIGTSIYYPLSLHLQECFSFLGYKEGDLPITEKVTRHVLAIPMYPELDYSKQKYVVSKIARFYGNKD